MLVDYGPQCGQANTVPGMGGATLNTAIRAGGTSLRDYVDTEGDPGAFRQKLYVYERDGQPCRVCKTPVRKITQGQRSSYFCPQCQT